MNANDDHHHPIMFNLKCSIYGFECLSRNFQIFVIFTLPSNVICVQFIHDVIIVQCEPNRNKIICSVSLFVVQFVDSVFSFQIQLVALAPPFECEFYLAKRNRCVVSHFLKLVGCALCGMWKVDNFQTNKTIKTQIYLSHVKSGIFLFLIKKKYFVRRHWTVVFSFRSCFRLHHIFN